MPYRKLVLVVLMLSAVVVFFALDLPRYFNLETLKAQQAAMDAYYLAHPWPTRLGFFLLYVLLTGLSLPVATILTLAAGALFGVLWGSIAVALASTCGATVAFMASRFLFHDLLQARLGHKLTVINAGIRRDGALYLFMMRLVPAFPFFVINAAMGLTPMRPATFFLVSLVAMLPVSIVYVNAGSQLARISSLHDIASPSLLASLALLGLLPLLGRIIVARIRRLRTAPGNDTA